LHDHDHCQAYGPDENDKLEESEARPFGRLIENQVVVLALVDVEIALALFELGVFIVDDVFLEVFLFAFFLVNFIELALDFLLAEKVGVLL
jgi:hypothetical protein